MGNLDLTHGNMSKRRWTAKLNHGSFIKHQIILNNTIKGNELSLMRGCSMIEKSFSPRKGPPLLPTVSIVSLEYKNLS